MKSRKEDREKAIELRKRGWSLKEIVKEIGAAKSSVSNWVRGIELTATQKERLKEKGRSFGNTYTADAFREKRRQYQNEGIKLLKKHGDSFLCGCMLYWGEGTKDRTTVSIINSDPYLLQYFKGFIIQYFDVDESDIRLHCTYYDGANINEVEEYWLQQLQLNRLNLRKSTKVKSMRKNHKYGMARLSIGNVKIVQSIYGAIQ
jgi:transcriptional regulator with XRE-family HTH domain